MIKSTTPIDLETLHLGESSDLLETETSEDCRLLAQSMARQARRRIRIISRHLDAPLYDNDDFVEAVKDMILNARASRVDIIVKNSDPIMRQGHRLVALAQRLSTYAEVRNPARQHAAFNGARLIVDDCAYIDRTFADRYEGTACFNDIRGARALIDNFEEMWQAATPDPDLRRLV